jgi:hypothetical protein
VLTDYRQDKRQALRQPVGSTLAFQAELGADSQSDRNQLPKFPSRTCGASQLLEAIVRLATMQQPTKQCLHLNRQKINFRRQREVQFWGKALTSVDRILTLGV